MALRGEEGKEEMSTQKIGVIASASAGTQVGEDALTEKHVDAFGIHVTAGGDDFTRFSPAIRGGPRRSHPLPNPQGCRQRGRCHS